MPQGWNAKNETRPFSKVRWEKGISWYAKLANGNHESRFSAEK